MFLRVFIFTLFVCSSVLLPQMIFAAPTGPVCTCFCATNNGAVKISDKEQTDTACEQLCKDKGNQVAVCAKEPRQFPGNNALCFSKDACTKQGGKIATQQARECLSGWSYCFPDPEKSKVKLSVKIGDLDTVGDIGVYMQAVYKWLLGVAALITVVFIMVGGFQYALGAGVQSQIAKGKERIKNGVIGLLLLIFAVLIAQTVNPQLLKLQVPRPSLIRQINLTDASCDSLKEQKYKLKTLSGDGLSCGSMAEIVTGPPGTTVPDGQTCFFKTCAQGSCIIDENTSTGQCVQCRNISGSNPQSPFTPNESTCQKAEVVNITDTKGTATYCTLRKAVAFYEINYETNIRLGDDSCLEVFVDCGQISQCNHYEDKVKVFWYESAGQGFNVNTSDPSMLGRICNSDPCGLKKRDKNTTCTWNGLESCIRVTE